MDKNSFEHITSEIKDIKSSIEEIKNNFSNLETQINLHFSKIYSIVGTKIDLNSEKKLVIKKYVSIKT